MAGPGDSSPCTGQEAERLASWRFSFPELELPRCHLYYEVFYGNYPLIHNSDLLGGCGYRYADFDCEDGGVAYLRAREVHDGNLANYRADAGKFLRTLDPLNPVNVAEYRAALLRVVGSPA